MEIYFKIIASFATGLIDRINITNNDIYENNMLTYLFRSNINNLTNEGYYNNAITSMIAEAKNYSKPIEIYTQQAISIVYFKTSLTTDTENRIINRSGFRLYCIIYL